MHFIWYHKCFAICLVFFCVATDSQKTCRYSHNAGGVCKAYKDCTELHGVVIFPSTDCEPDKICCPRRDGPTLINIPLHINNTNKTLVVSTTPTPNSASIATTSTQVTPKSTDEDKTTRLPVTKNVENNLNPRGLNILNSQKCGSVYASKSPNGSNIEADILEFPWMALLQYEGVDGQSEFSCGGSLIAERWVLTSAQCIKPILIGVRLGDYNILENTKRDCSQEKSIKVCTQYEDFKISRTVTHPEYDSNTSVRDIGLVKLKIRARRSRNIKPICLPTQTEFADTPFDDRKFIVAGWKSTDGGSSKILKKHIVNQQRFLICMLTYPLMDLNTDDPKLCVAGRSDDQLSTCSGDPGSPVFWLVNGEAEYYMQIGIVPLGMEKCGGENSVPYYVERVADSMDWITKVIGEDN